MNATHAPATPRAISKSDIVAAIFDHARIEPREASLLVDSVRDAADAIMAMIERERAEARDAIRNLAALAQDAIERRERARPLPI